MEKQAKTLKVGYIAPMSIAAVNGGIRTQALKTIEEIAQFSVEPVLISPWKLLENQKPDLVHIFGATIENVGIAKILESQSIPFVLSPVHYSNRSSNYVKNVLRIEKGIALLGGGIRSEYAVKAELCGMAEMIFPNTDDEARLIEQSFSIPSQKISVVPNGVESRFADADAELFESAYKIKDFVLFAGQAGAPRKNVIQLLEIAPHINAPVVIIGDFYDDDYGKKCLELAEKTGNVLLIETLDHDSDLLASAYAACKVFVLPSLFETPGISAMEAALTGSNIVITKNGGTKFYFKNEAEYTDPASKNSLLKAISLSLKKEKSDTLKNHLLAHFTWKKVAEQTADLYKSLLS